MRVASLENRRRQVAAEHEAQQLVMDGRIGPVGAPIPDAGQRDLARVVAHLAGHPDARWAIQAPERLDLHAARGGRRVAHERHGITLLSVRRQRAQRRRGLDAAGRKSYHKDMKTTVSEKGQITIPKAVRTKLGLRPGTVLELEAERGRLVGRKASGRDIVDELYGSLPLDESVDDYLERARGR